jgi:hypothetical protein
MSRFTEEQIRYAVQQAEAGQYGVALATFYRWRQKYGALTKSELVRPNELEREKQSAEEAWGRADAGQADPSGRARKTG